MNANLQQRLDAYVEGECGPRALADELLARCAQAPHATWEVLALLDQYHRRGKLPLDLYRSVSQTIQRRALGVQATEPTPTLAPVAAGANASANANANASANASASACASVTVSANADTNANPQSDSRADSHADTDTDTDAKLSRELLLLRKELQTARRLAAAYLEQLKSLAWQLAASETVGNAQETVPVDRSAGFKRRVAPQWPARRAQAVAAMVFMLAVGASQGVGEREAAIGRVRPAPIPVRIPVPGQLSLATDTFIVQPGSSTAQIAVQRTGGTDGVVSFVWSTQSAGARAGTDFRARPAQRLAMADGVNALKVSVPILPNPARRHTEMFYVTIGKPEGGAALGDRQRAAVFIMRP